MPKIDIKCRGSFTLPYSAINSIQGNLKELSRENYKKLRDEIAETGFAFPVNVTKHPKKGYVTQDGWHRVLVVKTMVEKEGYECPELPCTEIDWESDEMAARRILQGSSQYAHSTNDGLYEFTETFKIDPMALDLKFDIPHFDFEEFQEEFGDEPQFQSNEDEVPEARVETDIKLGDMFQLGEHRLLCGDSTDKAQVDKLMGGEKADMVFTDPPYGMNVVKPDDNIGGNRKAKCGVYRPIIGDDKPFDPTFLLSLCELQIIWGANHFSNKLPTSPHWIVWNKEMPDGTDFSGAELAWTNIDKKAVKVYKFTWAGMTREGDRKDELNKRVHPTQKPVGLFQNILNDYDPRSVIDPYGGSGSTLIACEKTKRKCFMMELDPQYVQVIIDRWEKFTGKKASKI